MKRTVLTLIILALISNNLFAFSEKDMNHFIKDCNSGDGMSCGVLGTIYAQTDKAKSKTYFKKHVDLETKSCNNGNAQSCQDVGFSYSYGMGVDKNSAKAKQFFKKACDGGHKTGCENFRNHSL